MEVQQGAASVLRLDRDHGRLGLFPALDDPHVPRLLDEVPQDGWELLATPTEPDRDLVVAVLVGDRVERQSLALPARRSPRSRARAWPRCRGRPPGAGSAPRSSPTTGPAPALASLFLRIRPSSSQSASSGGTRLQLGVGRATRRQAVVEMPACGPTHVQEHGPQNCAPSLPSAPRPGSGSAALHVAAAIPHRPRTRRHSGAARRIRLSSGHAAGGPLASPHLFRYHAGLDRHLSQLR